MPEQRTSQRRKSFRGKVSGRVKDTARAARDAKRPGSVMIMVVALLVLLALMGTAYVTTVRYDRSSSIQHVENTQVDMLVSGAINLMQAKLVDDLFDNRNNGSVYRSATHGLWGTADNHDGPAPSEWQIDEDPTNSISSDKVPKRDDNFLADRVPEYDNDTSHPEGPNGSWYWRWISGPLRTTFFEDPFFGEYRSLRGTGTPNRFFARRHEAYPSHLDKNGTIYPAFREGFADTNGDGKEDGNDLRLVAADTDGDGIADAALSRLMDGPVNGLTWYVATRTIDNAGAINLSVAWEDPLIVRETERYGSGNPSNLSASTLSRLFPTNIDLHGMMLLPQAAFGAADRDRLSLYRAGIGNPNGPGLYNGDTSGAAGPTPYNAPMDDNGLVYPANNGGPQFTFHDRFDAFWTQLGRRTNYPGYNGFYGGTRVKYQRLPVNDSLELASGFVVASSTANYTTYAQIPNTLNVNPNNFRAGPYLPNEAHVSSDTRGAWGPTNFPVNPNSNFYNRQPYFTTYNPVAMSAPAHFLQGYLGGTADPEGNQIVDSVPHPDMAPYFPRYRGTYVSGRNYSPGDVILFNWSGGIYYTYTCTTATSQSPSGAATSWKYMPNSLRPMKTALNTAPFEELWRSFWNVMAEFDDAGVLQPPRVVTPGQTNGPASEIFTNTNSSMLRDTQGGVTKLTTQQQVVLRAAIAAINAVDLRDSDDDVSSHEFTIPAGPRVTVYGTEKQPFITEVYASTLTDPYPAPFTGDPPLPPDPNDVPTGKSNPRGYVAIELYNPYDTDIRIENWQIACVDRSAGGTSLAIYENFDLNEGNGNAPITLPARSFLVLENFKEGSTTVDPTTRATHRAALSGRFSGTLPPTRRIYVPKLHRVFKKTGTDASPGGELVLLKPRRADGKLSRYSRQLTNYTEGLANPEDMVPVDSFDFTGLELGPAPRRVYYCRPNGANNAWNFVYPGIYTATRTDDRYQTAVGATTPRADADYDAYPLIQDPVDNTKFIPEREPPITGTPGFGTRDDTGTYTVRHPGIQLVVNGWGPNKWPQMTPPTPPKTDLSGPEYQAHKFPFGGFARVSDVLQVPFIGAYTVHSIGSTKAVMEMNPVTMDASIAEDDDEGNDSWENIGRFCPIIPWTGAVPPGSGHSNYHWAKDIFDYFTVFAPHDDYMLDVDPSPERGPVEIASTTPGPTPYVPTDPTSGGTKRPPKPVNTADPGNADQALDGLNGVEGLININTAPWRVLAAVPWTKDPVLNRVIARAIVDHRNQPLHDPTSGAYFGGGRTFETLFDLLDMPIPLAGTEFQQVWLRERNRTGGFIHDPRLPDDFDEPEAEDGDFSQGATTPTTDGVRKDFEERFAMLSRVSNLLTTRSDTFTTYLTIQGWRDAGSASAKMEVQRRFVILFDRSAVTPTNREVRTILHPID